MTLKMQSDLAENHGIGRDLRSFYSERDENNKNLNINIDVNILSKQTDCCLAGALNTKEIQVISFPLVWAEARLEARQLRGFHK